MDAQSLTPRQERFVSAYTSNVALFNATKSCRLAGYYERSSRDTGYENLRKPHIKKAITEKFEAAFDANELTFQKVLGDLEMTRRFAMSEGKYGAALRATALQGKYLSMFSTKFQHSHEIPLEEASGVLVRMTDFDTLGYSVIVN